MSAALEYPVADPPEPGAGRALAPGVHWLRLPVPGALRHINVWLLEDGDGWTLVDTGMNLPEARAAWEGGLEAYLGGRRLRRIVCTHHHPDHAGLAVWLAARHPASILMSAPEHALMRRLALAWTDAAQRQRRVAAWARAGLALTPELQPILEAAAYRRVMSGVPAAVDYLGDGDVLATGAGRWTVRLLGGHSDGLLVLHEPQAGLLIASDQVLPRITSNIGAYPEREDPDPVATYLASFAGLEALDPAPLVLPSHGNVFRGLKLRLAELRAHHAATLATVLGLIDRPATAAAVALRLFRSPLDPFNTMLAVGESLAHLRHLAAQGRATVTGVGEDPWLYQRSEA